MFGPLKKFFSRQEAEAPAPPLEPPPPAPAPKAPARPAPAPASRPASGATPSDSAAPQPSASPTAGPASAPPPGATTLTTSETIKVPLKDICDRLPDNIKAKFIKLPTAGSTIPLLSKVVLTQLKQGAVRVPFKDVRGALPNGSFPDLAEFDHTLVDVPIAAVLPLLKPTDLYPKPSQRKLEVPAEIPGLFGPHGEPLSPPPSKKAEAKPQDRPAAATAAPAPTIKPATPAAPAAPIAPRPATPAAGPSSAPIPGPSIPAPNIPAPNLPPTNFPKPPAPAPKPAAPASPLTPASAPIQMPGAPKPAAPVGAPATARSGTSMAASSAAVGNISIPVSAVLESLPENVRGELSNHGSAAFTLPAEQIGQLLKTGRVMFPWKVLRASLRPNPPTEASAHDEIPVELPLKVVAPLFMTQGKPTFTQKKVLVGENIPDLFAGGPPGSKPGASTPAPAASAAPAAPASPAPTAPAPLSMASSTAAPLSMASSAPAAAPRPAAPAAQPAAAPTMAQPAKAPADLAELFGQPGKKNWTPNEIVQKSGSLPGVSGALIAMQDGLLVASQLPGAMKGDTVAAFIPQIFGRMNQYTQDLKLGELNHLTLSVDQVPWHFAKVGNVYFAAVGNKGESLPLPHLILISSELARQNR